MLQGHFFAQPWLDVGGLGVLMFFALSGLLMADILFTKRQALPVFYRRRIGRIVPAFVVFVLAMFALAALQKHAFTAAEFWSTLFFMRTYLPSSGIWGTGMPIGHLWSLNVEEHCYLFMSVLVLVPFLRRREGWFLLACGSACTAIGFLYVRMGSQAPRWGSLGTEVAGAFLLTSAGYRLICGRFRPAVPGWLPLAAFVAAFGLSQAGPWWSRMLLLPLLLAFSVNHLAETGIWFRRFLSAPVLRRLGLWSFSLYLWQQPWYQFKAVVPGGAPLALAAAFAFAMLSFYSIERPARQWINARGARPPMASERGVAPPGGR